MRRAGRIAILCLLVATSCSGQETSTTLLSTTSSVSTPETSTTEPPASAGDGIELTTPERELTAWEIATAGIGPDGTVPKEVALKAFTITFGDVPGIETPSAPEIGVRSGTATLDWLTILADQLTDEERAAVEEGVRATTATRPALYVSNRDLPSLQASGGEISCTLGTDGRFEDAADAAAYRVILDQEIANVEQALGQQLGIPIYLGLGQVPPGRETMAWVGLQTTGTCASSTATSCEMELMTNHPDIDVEAELRSTIVHELVHCFAATWVPIRKSQETSRWLAEGFADFLGALLHPDALRRSFRVYIGIPNTPLYQRSYDGIGFFFHLHSVGGDPMSRFRQAYIVHDNSPAFAHLVEGLGNDFDDTWPSVLAQDPGRGDAWYMPDAPPTATAIIPEGVLTNGKGFRANPGEAETRIAHVVFAADVVQITVDAGAHGRVNWDGAGEELLTSLNGATYCAKDGGCDCPPGSTGSPPKNPIPSKSAMFAAAGITQPTNAQITGLSIDEFCKEAPAGLDPCVVGTWASSEWDLPGPAGLEGHGGAGAVVTISADGQAEWDFDAMEPIVIYDEVIDVTTEQHTQGSATGLIEANLGTWTVSNIDQSQLVGFAVDSVIGQYDLAGGPGLFVLMLDGSYNCSGNTLTYTTVDPVEEADVTVVMNRR